MRSAVRLPILILALGIGGCGAGGDQSTGAQRQFEMLCSTCHGALGRGDGPASRSLRPQPRDLGDRAWQDSVDDAHLRTVIALGSAAAGLSPAMTGWGHALDAQQLEQMVIHVRSLRRD